MCSLAPTKLPAFLPSFAVWFWGCFLFVGLFFSFCTSPTLDSGALLLSSAPGLPCTSPRQPLWGLCGLRNHFLKEKSLLYLLYLYLHSIQKAQNEGLEPQKRVLWPFLADTEIRKSEVGSWLGRGPGPHLPACAFPQALKESSLRPPVSERLLYAERQLGCGGLMVQWGDPSLRGLVGGTRIPPAFACCSVQGRWRRLLLVLI